MRRLVLLTSLLLALAAAGCGNRAEEMFDTAEFEELQNNQEHARRLYRQIIERYPESAFAGKARARLTSMDRTRERK